MSEPLPAIDEPTVIFVINRLWSPDSDDESVYAATRGDWKVGASTRERGRIALGIAGNVVRGAYRIDGWQPGRASGRWRFDGTPAPELDAIGKTVVHLAARAGGCREPGPPVSRWRTAEHTACGGGFGAPAGAHHPGAPIRKPLCQPGATRVGPDIAPRARAERDPLARIMYGQRELFHSNFLADQTAEQLIALSHAVDAGAWTASPSGPGRVRDVASRTPKGCAPAPDARCPPRSADGACRPRRE